MISIIAAIGKNRELGARNKLLWHISEDMERFKKLTTGQVVIMGRKTYESIPEKFRPLPNRVNIIVSRSASLDPSATPQDDTKLLFCSSIEDAIAKAKQFNKEIFIIGGAQIYGQSLKYTDKLYLTLVDKEYPDADVFFPDYSLFKNKIKEEERVSEGLKFKFIELVK